MIYRFTVTIILSVILFTAGAQSAETAGEYMSLLANQETELSEKYLNYMSEVAHGNRARKSERKRQELISEIKQSLSMANKLRPYKGDASLRDAYKKYWDVLLKVFTEDYHKIVNMEEIAEQSYDAMEAYLLAKEKAGEVLSLENEKVRVAYKEFALKNNIRLVDTDSKMSRKLRQVGDFNVYYNKLYLIFFKSYKQEGYVTKAVNEKDINAIEQNRVTLQKFAEEGLGKLDTLRAFKGDGSLITACRKVLEFHKSEAVKDIPVQSEFVLKQSEFEKIQKAFTAKPESKRTKDDVVNYNKAIDDYNAAIVIFNKSNQTLNASQSKVLENWNNSSKRFMELHVPR